MCFDPNSLNNNVYFCIDSGLGLQSHLNHNKWVSFNEKNQRTYLS